MHCANRRLEGSPAVVKSQNAYGPPLLWFKRAAAITATPWLYAIEGLHTYLLSVPRNGNGT